MSIHQSVDAGSKTSNGHNSGFVISVRLLPLRFIRRFAQDVTIQLRQPSLLPGANAKLFWQGVCRLPPPASFPDITIDWLKRRLFRSSCIRSNLRFVVSGSHVNILGFSSRAFDEVLRAFSPPPLLSEFNRWQYASVRHTSLHCLDCTAQGSFYVTTVDDGSTLRSTRCRLRTMTLN